MRPVALVREEQLAKLSELLLANAASLRNALEAASRMSVGAFRVLSPLFPRHTHPEVGYALEVWKTLSATIDVEARAKELAVMKLMRDLDGARQGS